MISLGFKPCKSDACLMYRVNKNGLCIILMYVDDNLIVGSNKATEGHMKELCRVIKYALDTQNIGLK